MRRGVLAACCLVLALWVPTTVGAASKTDRATGGGQILFATRGAGNTISFTAQGTSTDAKGQLQFVDRSAGKGGDQVVLHGEVTCIDAMGSTAKVAGVLRNGDTFNLYVEDTGEGLGNSDVIFFNSMADDPTCEFDTPAEDDLEALARGNAQVYDADPPA